MTKKNKPARKTSRMKLKATTVEIPANYNLKTGQPWDHTHEKTGTRTCNACQVEDSAPRVGGQAWTDFTHELIGKLGFSPRYPGVTDEQHLVELIGRAWADDAKKKWVVNWTVDGYLARRPNLRARNPPLQPLKAPNKEWGVDAEIGSFFDIPFGTKEPALDLACQFRTLATAIAALPPSFSHSSALRKLLEAKEATMRAVSMKFAAEPKTSWQVSAQVSAPVVYVAVAPKAPKKRRGR